MIDIDKILKEYDSSETERLRKWFEDYIVPLDIENIAWLNLTGEEMQKFLIENYVDENSNYVCVSNSIIYNVLGMKYLSFYNVIPQFNYIVGVIPNRVGKKTIVSCLCYEKNRIWDINQENLVNFIQNIETNIFYRYQGLFSTLITKIISCIDLSKDLVISDEEDDGLDIHTIDRITEVLRSQGYDKNITSYTSFKSKAK